MSLTIGTINKSEYKKNVNFGLNPYKPIEKAHFDDLIGVINKAHKTVSGNTTPLKDYFSKKILSVALLLTTKPMELVNYMRNGHHSVKNLGDLYLSFKNSLAIEKAANAGEDIHMAMTRSDFSGTNRYY